MDQSVENRIRERAYEMWTAHGCVHGKSGAALACRRTGSVSAIDGHPSQTRSEEESTVVVRTFEDRQNAHEGWLTQSHPRCQPLFGVRSAAVESDHRHGRLLRVSAAGN